MSCPKAHKLMLVAVFSLALTNTSTTSTYNDDRPIYIASFLIGIAHGGFKKISEYVDFKEKKDNNFKNDRTFEFFRTCIHDMKNML